MLSSAEWNFFRVFRIVVIWHFEKHGFMCSTSIPKPQFASWLIKQVETGQYLGLCYVGQNKFKVPWKHNSRKDCNDEDSKIFRVGPSSSLCGVILLESQGTSASAWSGCGDRVAHGPAKVVQVEDWNI